MLERREWIEERTEALRSSNDPEELQVAAEELAASDDPEALQGLAEFLSQDEFLKRLDNVTDPGKTILHLRSVLRPFIESPSPEVAAICARLADSETFRAVDERTPLLLDAVAKVRPMSDAAIEFIRTTNEEGYYAPNTLRLIANGSPPALKLFAAMIADRSRDWEERVDCLHMCIVPHRTRLSTLELAEDLLTTDLETTVAQGVIESVFDFRWQWFGSRPPEAPAWRTADTAVLRYLVKLSEATRRYELPASLEAAVQRTVGIANAWLAARHAA